MEITILEKNIMDKIAILIPCYNEEKTIEKVVKDWKKELPDAVVYVYDNNSTDRTVELAKKAGAVVRYEYSQGKGNVIRRMFREINAECYIMVDGDDTYPAEYGKHMAELVLYKNVDMVIGDRLSSTYFEENKRPFHNFGNSLVRETINRLFHTNIRVEKNMCIENVIIEYRDRPEGSESKLNTYSDGIKVLKTIGRLYKNYRPMNFFGMLSALLGVISLIMFIPVLYKYIQTGMVPNFPTLIVSGFVALAAMVSFFSGLILSEIVEKERREYEFRLQMIEMNKEKVIK